MKLHILGICGTFMGGVAALAREQGHARRRQRPERLSADVHPARATGHRADARAIAPTPSPPIPMWSWSATRCRAAIPRSSTCWMRQLDYTSGAAMAARQCAAGPRHAGGRRHPRQDHDHLHPRLPAGCGRSRSGFPGRRRAGEFRRLGAARLRPGIRGRGRRIRHRVLRQALASSCTTGRWSRSSTTSSTTTPTSSRTWPRSSASSTTWCASCRGSGRLIVNGEDAALREVLAMGCWTPVERFAIDGEARVAGATGRATTAASSPLLHRGQEVGVVRWPMLGRHNVMNGLAALAAAHAVGVDVAAVMPALADFVSVKRRMEVIGSARGITVYDDFAHHPTAIRTTLEGLRARVGAARILVAMEPRSNSMRLGAHADADRAVARWRRCRGVPASPGTAVGCRQGGFGAAWRRARPWPPSMR